MFSKQLLIHPSQNPKLVHGIEALSLNTRHGSGAVHYTVLAPVLEEGRKEKKKPVPPQNFCVLVVS